MRSSTLTSIGGDLSPHHLRMKATLDLLVTGHLIDVAFWLVICLFLDLDAVVLQLAWLALLSFFPGFLFGANLARWLRR